MERQFIAHTSSSDNTLYFKSLRGIERLSEAYQFEIELLSEKRLSDPISLHKTILTVEIKNKSAQTRYLSGYIEKISYAPFYKYDDRLYLYTATVRPKLWELKQSIGYSIWQDNTVPDIIAEVLNKTNILFENQLVEKYRTWEYCVKHNETDFDFIHRLMEHEGIYYYFKHEMGNHTMILVDAPQSHEPMPGYKNIYYINKGDSPKTHIKEYIYNWNVSSITIPNTYSLDDYDFRKPRAELYTATQTPISSIDNTEIFIWPGRYVENEQGQFYARVRQQAAEAKSELINSKGNVLGIAPGHIFTLSLPNDIKGDDHGDYLIIGAHYFLYEKPYIASSPDGASDIVTDNIFNALTSDLLNSDADKNKNTIQFEAIPASTHWKPLTMTPWPKVTGLETAVVTGPKDKQIWTDKYGRIKVKFRWDKDRKKDDTRSCWVRVASHWAGWRYGSICVPRVGEEVVISFVNGDPDKPLVIGSTYNNENMPPWELPKYETRVGIMSNTKGGKHDQANYLFLDDEPDKELFDLHAERNMNISVEKDKKVTIDGSRTTEIKKQQKDTVTGNANFTYKANHETSIQGKDTLTINNGQQETIKNGRKTEINGGDTYTLKGNLNAKIDGNWVQNITGVTAISSPNLITIKSDTNVVIDSPNSVFSASIASISTTALSLSAIEQSYSTGLFSASMKTMNQSFNVNEFNKTIFSNSQTSVAIDKAELALDDSTISIENSNTNISNSSLHILN
ncbi:type VI secretion system Vgr family protein [Xenorhabdus ehlersii]|uniref:Type VI secretion system secreted protein VgrG n=1 Tax=Xenorhabdus ehlersii TaxID=290111 RepID=A0A2D0IS55_9GAMM|nr:type VI secretion system tip protein TssI/VgrG [Xenorhabdus ehlersii]PHM24703.1 type VI secretion system substrate VgrG1b [Xenorhabdus ehlersii]RKE91341.1 type VI secretion system secreted protein VgrG [Xenorhabdus ehlersii]